MEREHDFTRGPILPSLLRFALPVLLALLLQAMYGAVDLQVAGKFGAAADISAVSTGSQVVHTVTVVIAGLAMGVTVLLGQKIGEGKYDEAGQTVGGGICLFGTVALAVTAVMLLAAPQMSSWMQAPADAFNGTVTYVRICSGGAPGPAGEFVLPGDHRHCQCHGHHRFCGSGRGGEAVRFRHAGALRLYAVHVRFRGPEYRRGPGGPGAESIAVRHPVLFCGGAAHGMGGLLPRGRAGGAVR